jgi:hypothetical protein
LPPSSYDGTDWSEAQAQVNAIASAKPDEQKRLSTVVSVKSAAKVEANGDLYIM